MARRERRSCVPPFAVATQLFCRARFRREIDKPPRKENSMNTRNVNVKTATKAHSKRYGAKENAVTASRSPDFPEIRRSAYTNSEHLTVPQVYDLFRYVCDAAGRSTG